jgi:hypothetical protein
MLLLLVLLLLLQMLMCWLIVLCGQFRLLLLLLLLRSPYCLLLLLLLLLVLLVLQLPQQELSCVCIKEGVTDVFMLHHPHHLHITHSTPAHQHSMTMAVNIQGSQLSLPLWPTLRHTTG